MTDNPGSYSLIYMALPGISTGPATCFNIDSIDNNSSLSSNGP